MIGCILLLLILRAPLDGYNPNSSHAYRAFFVVSDGMVHNGNDRAGVAMGVAPVLYLNSNQSIIGGDGSRNNPYQLKA